MKPVSDVVISLWYHSCSLAVQRDLCSGRDPRSTIIRRMCMGLPDWGIDGPMRRPSGDPGESKHLQGNSLANPTPQSLSGDPKDDPLTDVQGD